MPRTGSGLVPLRRQQRPLPNLGRNQVYRIAQCGLRVPQRRGGRLFGLLRSAGDAVLLNDTCPVCIRRDVTRHAGPLHGLLPAGAQSTPGPPHPPPSTWSVACGSARRRKDVRKSPDALKNEYSKLNLPTVETWSELAELIWSASATKSGISERNQ